MSDNDNLFSGDVTEFTVEVDGRVDDIRGELVKYPDDRYGQRDHELFCPYCGERGCASGDNYCVNCGAELTGTFE